MQLASQTFGRRLKAIREHRDLTQEELGTAIGKSKQTISYWERNGTRRRADIRKCARVLRCRSQDLLAPLDAPIPPPPSRWPQIRRQFLQRLARPAALASRVSRPRAMESPALERAVSLLMRLTAREIELLLELKKCDELTTSPDLIPQI